jgi:prepilin-type N-terminal cleavage/methylation domain-containing protein
MKRGFSLIEILVSLAILAVVGTATMMAFGSQHQNWKSETDRVESGMMAMGTLDEIGRGVRSIGGGLPLGRAGISSWRPVNSGITFVVNRSRWIDTAGGYTYLPTLGRLQVAVRSAAGFTDSGYALVPLTIPTSPGPGTTPSFDSVFALRILERVSGGACTSDSLVLDASGLSGAPNNWTDNTSVKVLSNGLVYNMDSVSFVQSHDTLMTWVDRSPPQAYALGIDTFRVQYHHPSAGWADTVSILPPAGRVDMVRLRLVSRNRSASQWLADHDPSSKGYRFVRLETEVSLRNDSLVNR